MMGMPVDPNMAGQFTGQHPQFPVGGPGQMTGQHQQYPGPGQFPGQGQMTGQHPQYPGLGQMSGQYPGYPPPDGAPGQPMPSYPGYPQGYPPPGYPQGVPPGYPPGYPPMVPPGYQPGYPYMPVDPSQMGMPPQMMPGVTPPQGTPIMPGVFPPMPAQPAPGQPGQPPNPMAGQPGLPANPLNGSGLLGNAPMEDSGKKPSRSKALGELLKKVSESDTPSPTSTAARLKALVEHSYAGPLPGELTKKEDEPAKGPPPSRSEVLSQLMRAVTDSPDSLVMSAKDAAPLVGATPSPVMPNPTAPAPTADPPVKKGLGLGSLLAAAEPAPGLTPEPKPFGGGGEEKPFGFSGSISNSIGSLNQVPQAENPFADAIDKLFDEPSSISVDKALKEAAASSAEGSSAAFNAVSGLMGNTGNVGSPEPAQPKPPRPLDASDSRVDALSRLLEAAQKAPEKPPGEDPKISRSSALNRMLDAVNEGGSSTSAPAAAGGDPFHAPDPFRGGTGDVISGPYGTPSTPPPSTNMRRPEDDPTASKTSQEAISARIEALNKKLEMSNSSRQQTPEDMLASMMQGSDAPNPMEMPQDVEPPSRAAVMNRILEQANFAEPQVSAPVAGSPPTPVSTPQAKYSANDLQALQKGKTKAAKKSKKSAKQKMSGPGFDWRTPVLVIAILAIGGGGFYAYQQGLIPGLSPKTEQGTTEPTDQDSDIQALLDNGNFAEVRKVLEKKQKDKGSKLSQEEIDQLAQAYIGLAKESSDQGKYTDAYTLLQKVSPKSSHSPEAKKLAAEAKSKAKPPKKKRRKR